MSTLHQDHQNLAVYESERVVRDYAKDNPKLYPAEESILNRIAAEIRDSPILDVGVGGGRTTSYLLKYSQDYTGIDFSGAMVEVCQRTYPQARFLQFDARKMASLGRGSFGFVLFSFNGLDSVSHSDRQTVLDQAHGLLKPGGLFLFSSHNLRVRPAKPWHREVYSWGKRPKTILRNFYEMLGNGLNYLRHARSQVNGSGYAVLIDCAHHFRLLNYYVDPTEQVRQLEAHGFHDILTFDRQGNPRNLDDPILSQAIFVHYLARK